MMSPSGEAPNRYSVENRVGVAVPAPVEMVRCRDGRTGPVECGISRAANVAQS